MLSLGAGQINYGKSILWSNNAAVKENGENENTLSEWTWNSLHAGKGEARVSMLSLGWGTDTHTHTIIPQGNIRN